MSFSSHCSTVPLNVSIVNIDINGLVPGSMLVTPAVSFESTNSVPVDVGGRASRWSWRSFYTLISSIHHVTSPRVSPDCHHICYTIVHSGFTDNTQSDQTTVL